MVLFASVVVAVVQTAARGVYIPARRQADTFTVLVANGNTGDRSLRAPLAQALANRGFGVLLFDYRGSGI